MWTFRLVGVVKISPQTSQIFSLFTGNVVERRLATETGLVFPLQCFSWAFNAWTVLKKTSHLAQRCWKKEEIDHDIENFFIYLNFTCVWLSELLRGSDKDIFLDDLGWIPALVRQDLMWLLIPLFLKNLSQISHWII